MSYLDDIVTTPLDCVKNQLKIIKIKYDKDIYFLFLETYLKIKNLFILLASYEYLHDILLTHDILITNFLDKINEYIEKIEKINMDEEHVVNIFKFAVTKIQAYKNLYCLEKDIMNNTKKPSKKRQTRKRTSYS